MDGSKGLWVVMPVYNEEASLKQVVESWIEEISKYVNNYVFLIVNDGSKDDSETIAKSLALRNPSIKIISHPNRGHGQSCIAGYRYAVNHDAAWIFQIDSDGQCDPHYFQRFWNQRTDKYALYGYRKVREDGRIRFYISRVTSIYTWLATGTWVPDPNVPYRLMPKQILSSSIKEIPSYVYMANICLAYRMQKIGAIKWLEINFLKRIGGTPSAKILQIMRRGFELFIQLRNLQ